MPGTNKRIKGAKAKFRLVKNPCTFVKIPVCRQAGVDKCLA